MARCDEFALFTGKRTIIDTEEHGNCWLVDANSWQSYWIVDRRQRIADGNFLNTGVDQYLTFGNALNKQYIEVLDLYVYNLGIGSGQISFSVAVGIMKSVVALVLFSSANLASKKIRGESVF